MNQAVEAYRGITATDEFRNLEWLRQKTMHDEAQAIYSAELRGEQRANEKWQGVVADKETELAYKDTELAQKETELAQKETVLANKDHELASKDSELVKQAKLIAELQAKLQNR